MTAAMTGARARVLALVLVIMLLLGEANGGSRRSEPRRRIAARTGPDPVPITVTRRLRATRGCTLRAKRPRTKQHCTRR